MRITTLAQIKAAVKRLASIRRRLSATDKTRLDRYEGRLARGKGISTRQLLRLNKITTREFTRQAVSK